MLRLVLWSPSEGQTHTIHIDAGEIPSSETTQLGVGVRLGEPEGGAMRGGSTIAGVMPTVFRERGFRFFFYSNECSPREPVHIHVERGDAEAKFWLSPVVRMAYNDGYDPRTLRKVRGMIWNNRDRIQRFWDEFFA